MAESTIVTDLGPTELVRLEDWQREALRLKREDRNNIPYIISRDFGIEKETVQAFIARKRKLASLDQAEVDALAIKYGITQECVIGIYAKMWSRLRDEFDTRDLKDVKTEKVFEMMISCYEKMVRVTKLDFDTMPEPHQGDQQDYAKILMFINDPKQITFSTASGDAA